MHEIITMLGVCSKKQSIYQLIDDNKQKKRASPRRWSQIEHSTFLEGLEKFGRDWGAISAMDGIDRRTKALIRSHAQKYFITLWKQNVPLPARVAETGNGYTLSGAPLDPNSGAARMYAKQGRGRSVVAYSKPAKATNGVTNGWYGAGRRKMKFSRARAVVKSDDKYPNRASFYGMIFHGFFCNT